MENPLETLYFEPKPSSVISLHTPLIKQECWQSACLWEKSPDMEAQMFSTLRADLYLEGF